MKDWLYTYTVFHAGLMQTTNETRKLITHWLTNRLTRQRNVENELI